MVVAVLLFGFSEAALGAKPGRPKGWVQQLLQPPTYCRELYQSQNYVLSCAKRVVLPVGSGYVAYCLTDSGYVAATTAAVLAIPLLAYLESWVTGEHDRMGQLLSEVERRERGPVFAQFIAAINSSPQNQRSIDQESGLSERVFSYLKDGNIVKRGEESFCPYRSTIGNFLVPAYVPMGWKSVVQQYFEQHDRLY